MWRIAFLSMAKSSAAGIALFSIGGFMGLPVNDPWFDVFAVYLLVKWAIASIVNGMPEPEENSSVWYIWCFRSLHSMAHIATAYFSHKRMWKFISGEAKD